MRWEPACVTRTEDGEYVVYFVNDGAPVSRGIGDREALRCADALSRGVPMLLSFVGLRGISASIVRRRLRLPPPG